ncbi:MAG: tRNA lysidine(34) synthetase TilS [Bacteroidota bacterium]
MNLPTHFIKHWQHQFADLNTGNCHLLLAVSGGVDSVVLTDLVAKSGFSFSIAHCNFKLRGKDSERDALFVSSLKGATDIFIKEFDTESFAVENKIAIQEAARKLRYNWFQDLMDEQQIRCNSSKQGDTFFGKQVLLVTAHHADDNIETVLMNFFRGTGILGLRGILPYQRERLLIRPLLPFRKKELISYATENQLTFVEDISNNSDKYTRNFFRNQLIPQIQNIFPEAEENILENIEKMREVATIYQDAIANQIEKLVVKSGKEIHIPILKLKQQKTLTTIVWEIAKTYGFGAGQVAEIIKIMDSDNGAFISSETHRIIRNRKWLIIAPKEIKDSLHYIIEAGVEHFEFSKGSLGLSLINKYPDQINQNSTEAFLDLKKIQFPLLLRKPSAGDYFYPLGMQKKKKISRFLIDQKLSKTQKEDCWIIESNKKIVWVIGYRIDDRFKLLSDTKQSLHIQFVSSKL